MALGTSDCVMLYKIFLGVVGVEQSPKGKPRDKVSEYSLKFFRVF